MLRACQRAVAQLQGVVSSGTAGARCLAAPAWAADAIPAGKKPFDPSGPLSQIDTLAEGLDHNDPMVKIALDMKNLKVAVEKLKAEEAMVRDSLGLAAFSAAQSSRHLSCSSCHAPKHAYNMSTIWSLMYFVCVDVLAKAAAGTSEVCSQTVTSSHQSMVLAAVRRCTTWTSHEARWQPR